MSDPPDRCSTGHSPAREIVELGVSKQQLYGALLGSQQVERGEVTPINEVVKRLRSQTTAS